MFPYPQILWLGDGEGSPRTLPSPRGLHHGGIRATFSQGCAVLSD